MPHPCLHSEPEPLNQAVVLVSYASGMPGFSPSEWIDSKLKAARDLGQKVTLITSADSTLKSCPHQKVIKVNSLSWRDFRIEAANIERNGNRPTWLPMVIAKTFGRIFDFLFFRAVGMQSDGRWSWVLSSLPVVWFVSLQQRPSALIATGGPSSALFATCLASFFPGVPKPIIELQDPFIGREMKLPPKVLSTMRVAQEFLLRSSRKYVVVSEGSRKDLIARFPKFSEKIVCVYPFSQPPDRLLGNPARLRRRNKPLEILHLGTLYGTRTLAPLFTAIDKGLAEGVISPGDFSVVNLGSDYSASSARTDYIELSPLARQDALNRASQSDVLLLVQHTDDRSLETIPFKFYDYLNLSRPILVIGRNREIEDLLSASDLFADINDELQILGALVKIKSLSLSGELQAERVEKAPINQAFVESWRELTS